MPEPTILLVEDDDRIRKNLCVLLSRRGHVVTAASTGGNGLEQARTAPFDAIVADMIMEGFEQFDLLDALVAAVEHTPIIVITGNTLLLDAEEAERRGACAYLAKPFPIAALIEAIDRCLSRQEPPC